MVKKEQLVKFWDYKLGHIKDVIKYLYSTLEYNTGGIADYFVRPIHRMNNKTLIKLYHIQNNSKLINAVKTYKTLK